MYFSDVSLPALFMPFKTGTIFNPRAHQYFHPTGNYTVLCDLPREQWNRVT